MRGDMAKVVTERPRRGHGNTSRKTTGRRIRSYDPDHDYDEPTRLPIARGLLAAAINSTLVAGENLTVGSAVGCRLRA